MSIIRAAGQRLAALLAQRHFRASSVVQKVIHLLIRSTLH